jgi:CHAD domain-containing protein
MATIQRERERKFDVAADVRIPDFEGASVHDRSTVTLSAEYWDTPDRRLLRWGHTLRHRHASDGSEDGWTLKLAGPPGGPDAAVDRTEINVAGPAQSPPPELRSLVSGITRRASVEKIATITTTRRRVLVSGEDEGEVEISDDHVSSTVDDAVAPTFRQVEVEAKAPGSDALLDAMSDLLTRAGASASDASKLERVLDDSPEPEIAVPRLDEDSTIDELARMAIGSGTTRLLQHDPAVRLGADPEGVHQARVATRRLRSDLKTLGSLLSPARVEGLRHELAWLGTLLGAVRDLDVLIGQVETASASMPDIRDVSPALIAELREERRVRHLELVDAMGSERYGHLVEALINAAVSPPLANGVRGGAPARKPLRKAVQKAWLRVPRAVERLDPDPPDEALHEIRKRAKRARYAAELASGVFGADADRFARKLERLQDTLGELQDAVMAHDQLARLGLHRLDGGPAFAAGELSCGERDRRRQARDRWESAWKAARRKKLRRWMN